MDSPLGRLRGGPWNREAEELRRGRRRRGRRRRRRGALAVEIRSSPSCLCRSRGRTRALRAAPPRRPRPESPPSAPVPVVLAARPFVFVVVSVSELVLGDVGRRRGGGGESTPRAERALGGSREGERAERGGPAESAASAAAAPVLGRENAAKGGRGADVCRSGASTPRQMLLMEPAEIVRAPTQERRTPSSR